MNPTDQSAIELRAVTPDDRDLLLSIYEASRETELSMVPWDAGQKRLFATHQFDAQTMQYAERYPDASHSIILLDQEPAGRLYVDRGTVEIAILDITILPQFRRHGIATHIVTGLQSEVGDTGRSVRIYVEKFNPSQKLFRSLGFEVSEEDDVFYLLRWKP